MIENALPRSIRAKAASMKLPVWSQSAVASGSSSISGRGDDVELGHCQRCSIRAAAAETVAAELVVREEQPVRCLGHLSNGITSERNNGFPTTLGWLAPWTARRNVERHPDHRSYRGC